MTNQQPSMPAAESPYIADILAQPSVLDALLTSGLPEDVTSLLRTCGTFERIVLTGMGSSLQGMYPAYLRLATAGLPVWIIDTAELLDIDQGLVTDRTLVWATSQSGEAAEIVELFDRIRGRRGIVTLGMTNEPESTLGTSAHVVSPLYSGDEQTVATRSYVNTLASSALAADAVLGTRTDPLLFQAPERISDYLTGWGAHLVSIAEAIPDVPTFVLGRGAALGTARMGALTIKEASRHPTEGMSVSQFRHGPLEMAGPGVTAIIVAGDDASDRRRNERMRTDLLSSGARCVWLDVEPVIHPSLTTPDLRSGTTRPLGDIVPLQLLTIVLAERKGVEPGRFRQIGKVTRVL